MPGNIRSVSVVLVGMLCLVLCSQPTRLDAAPLCTNAEAGCHVLSLANLFDRVIQHSARMHGISNDLHSEFELYFLPSKNQVGRMQMLGILSNSVSSLMSPEAFLAPGSAEWRLMKDYELLYCFRRDSNKVQNYLKILKCRIVPEDGC
uniref:Prolactin-like n=1 Tax=Neolamprologus brichardi TaxID=32507 RepID=A0A3Q4I1I3_NEOBR